MKGWKTIAANVLMGAIYFLGWEQLTEWVSPQMIGIFHTVLNLVLRWITTGPVALKKAA